MHVCTRRLGDGKCGFMKKYVLTGNVVRSPANTAADIIILSSSTGKHNAAV